MNNDRDVSGPTSSPDMGQHRAPRILIVEDNVLIAMDLEDILKSCGCEVIGPSISVTDALARLDGGGVDAAVVDYLLEDGTAAPLTKALDEKGIPYAICTVVEELDLSSQYPNTPILEKPYNTDDLSRVVNSLVASRLAGV